jgi:diguanylate cyclase (GGDEF)-like protein
MFRRLTTQVTLATLAIVLLIAPLAVVIINSMLMTFDATSHWTEHTLVRNEMREQFDINLMRGLGEAHQYARSRNREDMIEARQLLAEARNSALAIDRLVTTDDHLTEESHATHIKLHRERSTLLFVTDMYVDKLEHAVDTRKLAAISHATAGLDTLEDAARLLDHKVDVFAQQDTAESIARVTELMEQGLRAVVVTFGVWIATLAIGVTLLQKRIVQPVRRLAVAANAVAEGRLDQQVGVTSRDEIGDLQNAFNHMVDNLQVQSHTLQYQVLHDALTNLPNRVAFMEHVAGALHTARHAGSCVTMLFLDLDNFKIVNDSLGHTVGDELLKVVGQRLQTCVQPTDVVARLGGDEFAILLCGPADESDAIAIAQQIQERLSLPLTLQHIEMSVAASIGIAQSIGGQDSADTLLSNADLALYAAKRSGRSQYAIFHATMAEDNQHQHQLATDLRHAVDRGTLQLHYQPIVDAHSGAVHKIEALVRWKHPRLGTISPSEFITLAEETGLILPLGRWVLQQACQHITEWNATRPADARLTICVNLSARELQHPDFMAGIRQIVEVTGVDPHVVELELTESVVMADVGTTIAILSQLRAMGFSLAIDDFGTGYSSLSYLRRFPFTTLKIDGSFTRGLGRQPENEAIVRAVIGIAEALGLDVTAEGVETDQQVAKLLELGCAQCQGYYFARPMSEEAFTLHLQYLASTGERTPTAAAGPSHRLVALPA